MKFTTKKSVLFQYAATQYQVFQDTNVHQYTVRLAVFYARNRIATWGNDQPVDVRPRSEDLDHFIQIRSLDKMIVDVSGADASKAAIVAKASQRPELFETV